MVYGILKLLNFAHGDVFMIGAYIGLGVLHLFGGAADPASPIWLVLVLMMLAAHGRLRRRRRHDRAVRVPTVAHGAADRAAHQRARCLVLPPVQRRSSSSAAQHRTYDTFLMDGGRLFESVIAWGPLDVVPAALDRDRLGTAGLMVDPLVIVSRTRHGQGDARDGRRPRRGGDDGHRRRPRDRRVTFVLGSALAGAGGVLFAMRSDVYPQMGFIVGLAGFVAAVIGGIGSIPGAMLGGTCSG